MTCTTDISAKLIVHSHCDGRFQCHGGHLMHYSLIVKLSDPGTWFVLVSK